MGSPSTSKNVRRIRAGLTLAFGLAVGIPVGLATYVFFYAKGYSYLQDDPKACINCHVMREQYVSWQNSSHHAVATCNTCHSPGNILQKYQSKAINGYWHSWAFTTGRFVEPIRIKEGNRRATERACLECHRSFLESSGIDFAQKNYNQGHGKGMACIRCHGTVGHAR